MGKVTRLPERNRSWLREIEIAYSKAVKRAEQEGGNQESAYIYAVSLAAEARGINDPREIERIQKKIIEDVNSDLSGGVPLEISYKFHFVSSYIFAHAEAGVMEERFGDRVMSYINETITLFDD